MKAGKNIIYWDTSVFLAWLKDEDNEPGVIEGIDATVRQIHNGQIILLTSIVTDTEVLRGRLSPDAQEKWEAVFKRRNVRMVVHDQRVGRKSNQIRECFDARGIIIETPDSIHLATAILYQADEMHTLDGKGKRKRSGDLLTLSGDPCVDGLKIYTPSSPSAQQSLLKGIPPMGKEND